MKQEEDKSVSRYIVDRIRSEFAEMPGLHLSAAQAQRLLNVDPRTWEKVSACLMESGFLRRTDKGCYARA
ncbi:MAG: hypothetical protein ACM3KM_00345 [Acidobacteriaceae bacterium]